MKNARLSVLAVSLLALAACGGTNEPLDIPTGDHYDRQMARLHDGQSILGDDGLTLFGGDGDAEEQPGSGIGVNGFLWRASLDTVSFMPVSSADPFGGVILTDWYTAPATPNERFKVNIYILGRQLRSDGVRVSIFRQSRDAAGGWVDAPVDAETERAFENTILSRAREFRVASGAAS